MTEYNFDDEDTHVDFTIQGHVYQFWYPTTKEALELQKFGDDVDKITDFIMNHVKKPEDATYPEFKEIYDTMTVRQAVRFNKMITELLSVG